MKRQQLFVPKPQWFTYYDHPASERRRAPAIFLWSVLALVTAVLVAYSQTGAFAWDEGFHLLIAQLIKRGQKPYIDFVFSQTPLNAYWNAAWMTAFGESWRVTHAIAALCSSAAMILTATFVLSRFPAPRWRLAGALIAALLVGLNVLVVSYGGVAQAYGLCLLSIVAAYRVGVVAVERNTMRFSALAGFLCGVAAASSLLTAPVSIVLLVWIVVYNRAGRRWAKAAAFALGETVAFIPVLWLLAQAPRQVFFGIIQYNLFYRGIEWPDATRHNLELLASWLDSGQALLLLLVSAGGLLFIYFRSNWDARRKAEFYLCAWMSIALAAHISSAHPTFARYYLFTVPFLSILAVAGVYAAASSLYNPDRPWKPVVVLACLLSLGLAKSLYEGHGAMAWPDLEKTARDVNTVTTPEQRLFADEAIYFLTRHAPPSGMEMRDSHKFNFPPALSATLHVVPNDELDRQVRAGVFSTLQTCEDQDYIEEHGFAKLYAKSAESRTCTVFWDLRSPASDSIHISGQ